MTKHILVPFVDPKTLDAKIGPLEAAGWIVTAVGHIAANNGPGALLYVLVHADDAEDERSPDPSGNGHDTKLPAPEVIAPPPGI